MSGSEKAFQLHGQSGGFSDRLNSIFGALDSKKQNETDDDRKKVGTNSSFEKRIDSDSYRKSPCKSLEKDNLKKPYNRSHDNRHSRHNRGKGGSARQADHVLNPNNYTKYR